MKNGITYRHTSSDTAHNVRDRDHIPVQIVIACILTGVIAFVGHIAFMGQSWLDAKYTALLMACSVLLIGAVAAQRQNKYPPLKAQATACSDDNIAHQILWTPLRPHVRGESRNSKIDERSTTSRLLISPILSFQYIAVILAAAVLACLVATSLTAGLPQILKRGVAATTNPVLTTFIGLLSVAVIACVAWLLRKPVRSIEFNKDLGVFWIEKYRVFGWKVGESAQMPIAQIHALQIISSSKHSANLPRTNQPGSNQPNSNQPQPALNQTPIAPGCQQQEADRHLAKDYEVNIVFRNSERVNIISHRNCRAITHDTGVLAAFLDVPIWDNPPTR